MADPSVTSGSNSDNAVGAYMKLLPTVAQAVKLSQELPSCNTPAYIYYNDFPQYKAISAGQSKKILGIIQNVLDVLDAKANVLDIPSSKCTREKFCSIVDANDRILEKMAVAMDIVEDPERAILAPKTNPEDLVVAVQRKNATSIEWLKPKQNTQTNQNESTERSGPDSLLKLLSSINIVRPQTSFSCPPDNSSTPFRPRLTDKPNSIVPLEDISLDVSDSDEYPHPYEAEITDFCSSLSDWKPLSPNDFPPQPLGCNYRFIEKLGDLVEAINEMEQCQEVAVDLEHHSYRSYLGITCLIQISTRSMDYIIDALALRDHLSCLNKVFTNPGITKVFHGSDGDLMWLQRDFSVYVVNLFDTGTAARVLRLGRFSLSYLLQHYVNVKANKQYQLADWRIRPLPQELIDYARTDTHYLLYIAALMCQELQDRNLLHVVLEHGQQQCLKLYKKPVFDPLGYLGLYRQLSGVSLSHRQLYALEHLFALRDSIARREDDSVHYVLPNHMLKVIAEVLPRESSGIFACCNPIPPLVRKYVHDLHKIILDARNRPIEELVVSSESLTRPTAGQENTASTNLPSAVINPDDFVPILPHDFTYPIETPSSDREVLKIPVHVCEPSKLGKTIYSQPVGNNDKSSADSEQLCANFLDPNRLFLCKILELLKKPCAALISTTAPVSNQQPTPSIAVVPDQEAEKHSPEPIIKLTIDTPQTSQTPKPSLMSGNQSTPLPDKYRTEPESVDTPTVRTSKGFDGEEVIVLGDQVPSSHRNARKRRRMRDTKSRNQSSTSLTLNQSSVNSSQLSTSENLPPFFARVAASAEGKNKFQSAFDNVRGTATTKNRKRFSAKNKRPKHQV